jgi:hypothetical protein
VLSELSAAPSWAVACVVIVTTATSTLIALAHVVVRALPQSSADRLEWWRLVLDRRRAAGRAGGAEDTDPPPRP